LNVDAEGAELMILGVAEGTIARGPPLSTGSPRIAPRTDRSRLPAPCAAT
jgi:hypothetical protein